ncbi:uncharacterized protein LOC132554282 [Ylistrum balloti]|uniref:uncharacterized protein LOC132554282 n=1 Tax=Ylistrum balloti TaxID=509963 RepID=UPI0029058D17|nr:uncharacterized protein LOC132554282 [Ylistrum balloti]
MAELHIQFSIAMVIAGILAEVVSILWYNDRSPWGHRTGERYLLTALVCDALLVVLLKFVTDQFYPIGRWEDGVMLSLFFALMYAALEAPHCVHNHRSFSWFFFHTIHKFLVCFVVVFALFYFRYLG